jgi:hypothetical protein
MEQNKYPLYLTTGVHKSRVSGRATCSTLPLNFEVAPKFLEKFRHPTLASFKYVKFNDSRLSASEELILSI